jgi:diaminopimelate epimerase
VTSELIKTEGSGNDFIIGTGHWAHRLATEPELVIRLCRRRRGIGADGALAVFIDSNDAVRLTHRNADGSESAFCANGTRCAARVAVDRLGCETTLMIRTGWAEIAAEVTAEEVTLELPPPTPPTELSLETDDGVYTGWHLSVGVPHLVLPATDLAALELERVARPLRDHPDLGAAGANVHFTEARADGMLAIRSLERGVDTEVLCCGSGVVAALLVTMAARGVDEMTAAPRSGDLLTVRALATPPVTSTRLTGTARLLAVIDPL